MEELDKKTIIKFAISIATLLTLIIIGIIML